MRNTIIAASAALLVGLGVGYSLNPSSGGGDGSTIEADPNKPLYWVAPMDSNYRRDKPGKSPMGMDLVPVYPGDEAGSSDSLEIDAAVVNNIGVRTNVASTTDLPREINTVGFITADENNTSHVHVRSAGWVEKLNRKAIGEHVEKDEVVFELYSPDLVNAQTELLQALRLNQPSLIAASGDRLMALGMTSDQLETLKNTRKPQQRIGVRAPQSGIIMSLNIGEGMYITPSTTVFSLTDLSTVWAKVDVFEGQSDWVNVGQQATMTLPFMPGEKWEGTVEYVYPTVEAGSRTVQARLSFPNKDGRLKPNMYGEVRLSASPLEGVVAIPREALIRTGKTDRVILALGEGKFRPAEVLAGRESGNFIEIKEGLSAGERIVTSGQFLIDSEASTNSAILRLLGAGDDGESGPHYAVGKLNEITSDGYANITHGPIDTMGMPGMTMNFKIEEGVDLTGLSPDKEVRFEVRQEEDGWLTVLGTDQNTASQDHGAMTMETGMATHAVSGTINSIDDGGTINITHGPIETLSMPGMRMDFQVGDGVDVSALAVGDQIDFEIKAGEDGWFIITKATKQQG